MTTLKRWNGIDWEYVGLPTNIGMTPQTIGYAEILTNHAGIVGSNVDLTGYTVTITVPEGRRIRISSRTYWTSTVTTDEVYVAIYEGGTQISEERLNPIGGAAVVEFATILTPTAGTHTYKLVARRFTGSGTLTNNAWSAGPGFMLIEDITGSTLLYQPASVPVGVLAQAQVTTAQTGITTPVDITGLSVNVVVPAGRVLKVTAQTYLYTGTTSDEVSMTIVEGATTLATFMATAPMGGRGWYQYASVIVSPSAGSHTYKVQGARSAGSGSLTNNSQVGQPSFIVVEDITPTPAPANTAPSSTLGYAEVIAYQSTITTEVDLTGLATTVTVPAGRRLRLTGNVGYSRSVADGLTRVNIKEGSTVLNFRDDGVDHAGNGANQLTVQAVISPTAGTHTYKLSMQRLTGTGNTELTAGPTFPSFILIEDITGSGVSGHIHSELDDSGWVSLVPYLVNGWLSYDNNYGPPRFRKKAGVVYVQGLIKLGTLGSVIATLPTGFRPSIPVLLVVGNEHNGATPGRLDVYSDGRIVHAGGAWNDYVTMSGIIFPADQ